MRVFIPWLSSFIYERLFLGGRSPTLGQKIDWAGKHIKPWFVSFTKLLVSLNGVLAGVAASADGAVNAVLRASLA